jgi:hypothetical protein
MDENGSIKEDLKLPVDDLELSRAIKEYFQDGK